ncbi:GNAT family N-acetyltransferase [Roseibium algae]|uniref:GNAT family N-acetyltransferase n=1 Tax=Roseibium algae TaxID=3123038 RepID=A0ABU8TMI5_9HYPH
MTDVPVLRTGSFLLRPMTYDDWPAYAELMASDRAQFMGGPYKASGAWALFCHDVAQWALFGHGALMIEEQATGACLGQVGINHGPLFPEKELGWLVYPGAEGRGVAFEAAESFRDWAFSSLKLTTLVSYIDPGNTRSIALAERLGATLDSAAPRNDPRDLVYRHVPQMAS